MSWAKLPSGWVLAAEPQHDFLGNQNYVLKRLSWRDHRKTAWAAAFMAIVLAVRLNEVNHARASQRNSKDSELEATGRVPVTYDDLQENLGIARQTVRRAISLLEEVQAIHVEVRGRTNWYELAGVNESGKWCQVPVDELKLNGKPFGRLSALQPTLIGLNALKIYLLLLALRNQKLNTAAIGYTKIEERTGVRRTEIQQALGALTSVGLIGLSMDTDARSNEDHSHRYVIRGLRGFGSR